MKKDDQQNSPQLAAVQKYKDLLINHSYGDNQFADFVHVASVISGACSSAGVPVPVVVGGLAVETYTSGQYTTLDIDMITVQNTSVDIVMTGLGFEKALGDRYYKHPAFDIVLEFPPPPLDGSSEKVNRVELGNGEGYYVIGIEDILIDRLREFKFWDKKRTGAESATQVIVMLISQTENIDFDYLKERAVNVDVSDVLEELLSQAHDQMDNPNK